MKQRRVNDAQVDRLLDAMKRDPKYRAKLAERVVASEGIPKLTATGKVNADYARRYKSTMRRFQRYVTEAGQKRSFAKAPVEYQRQVRQEARAVPAPPPRPPPPRPPPAELSPHALEHYYERLDQEDSEGEGEGEDPGGPASGARSLGSYQRQYLYRSIVAYHDGDSDNAADHLGLSRRGANLLSLATEGEGVNIGNMQGAGEVRDAVADYLLTLPFTDLQDIRDFHDFLSNLPDWEIGIILADMQDGDTTFADWLDKWREYGMDYDDLLSDPEFWKMWRAAYAKSKGKG